MRCNFSWFVLIRKTIRIGGTDALPGTSSDIGNEGPMFGQYRQTARKERTCLLILGMSGANRFIGVYRVISGRERKRTQVLRDFSWGTPAIFVNVPRFIVLYRLFIGNLTHTKDPRQTHDASGVGRVYSVGVGCLPSRIGSLPVCSGLHRV